MIYFSSDTHFNHKNIIDYANRPFGSVGEMNETIIENWNEKVDPNEHVYFLGDFGFGKAKLLDRIRKKLTGEIYFITGNHDHNVAKIRNKFKIFKSYYEVNCKGYFEGINKNLILFHYPIQIWNKSHYGSIHLHGHEHSGVKLTAKNRIDVGVDSWNYEPVSLFEILDTIEENEPINDPFENSHHQN